MRLTAVLVEAPAHFQLLPRAAHDSKSPKNHSIVDARRGYNRGQTHFTRRGWEIFPLSAAFAGLGFDGSQRILFRAAVKLCSDFRNDSRKAKP
jgi:hypothetical protein